LFVNQTLTSFCFHVLRQFFSNMFLNLWPRLHRWIESWSLKCLFRLPPSLLFVTLSLRIMICLACSYIALTLDLLNFVTNWTMTAIWPLRAGSLRDPEGRAGGGRWGWEYCTASGGHHRPCQEAIHFPQVGTTRDNIWIEDENTAMLVMDIKSFF
jgi:hypothetical protein